MAPSESGSEKTMRICAFYSPGHDFARVLERLHRAHPEAHVTAVVPAGYTVAGPLRDWADAVVETELERYTLGHPRALARLVSTIRRGRYDLFAVMFASPKLRVLAALSGAERNVWCTPDGSHVPLGASVAGALAGELARVLRGRLTYMGLWCAIRMRRTRPRVVRR